MIKGKVHKYGDNVDTDAIIPARYLNVSEVAELALHCMEGLDSNFVKKVNPGDIMLAEKNFGCGSSREHAPLAIKASGISCIIAKSFARIFFRNAINIGLPILECTEAVDNVRSGQTIAVELSSGKIMNMDSGKEFTAQAYPQFMYEIIAEGGLIEYTKKRLER
ncbi:MAG: 3-isopropylmalate dehydratase small subunit [Dehalococcoidia bacterium]|nr:MAG: 3-isopropylmalate dehydratase small subunit [Dehalococcoidia bacterium]